MRLLLATKQIAHRFEAALHGVDDRGCALTWAVTFEAADNWRAALWQRVTENVIDTAAGNLAAYVATPLLHEIELALPNCASPAAARDAFAAPAPPSADPFHAAPAAPGVYHGGWGGQQPPPSNAFFAAPDQVFESPAQNKAAPRNTASPDLFGDSVAPSTVSSGEKKKAAKNFDFGLHSELVSLDLNANGAPPKAKSAIKKAPAVAMNKMATTERRSSMLSTAPMGMPQPAIRRGAATAPAKRSILLMEIVVPKARVVDWFFLFWLFSRS